MHEGVHKKKRRLEVSKAVGEHPATTRDRYSPVFLEAIGLLVNHIKDRFNQPSFIIFQRLESILIRTLVEEIEVLESEIEEIGNIYDEIDVLAVQIILYNDG